MDNFKKVWKDPVWSQVIAGLIIAWIAALTANYTSIVFPLLTITSILAFIATAAYQWINHQNSGFALDANEN